MYNTGIIIMSDKGFSGERVEKSGKVIREMLPADLYEITHYEIIPDERDLIQESLVNACDKLHLDLVLTSGGTGLSSRDLTPEVTAQVVHKVIPGIGEAMRAYGMTIDSAGDAFPGNSRIARPHSDYQPAGKPAGGSRKPGSSPACPGPWPGHLKRRIRGLRASLTGAS